MTKVLWTLILVCSATGIVFSQSEASKTESDQKVYLKLKGIDGKMYDVAEMRGQVVLVAFGATWCVPCNEEIPVLEQLKQEYKGRPVRFLWVSVERREQISDGSLREFARQRKMTFTVLRDPTQFNYAQFSFRVRVPLVVFFDKDGKFAVGSKHFGMSEPEEYKKLMRSEIDRLLAETGVSITDDKPGSNTVSR